MEEKKGKNVGLIISCIVNVILIGIIVAGVIFYEKGITEKKPTNDVVKSASRETTTEENVVNTEQEKPEVQEAGETATQKSNKIDESKDWVYKIKQKLDEPFGEDDELTEDIEIPQINLNFEEVKYVNEQIRNGAKDGFYNYEINYYLNKDILSLVYTDYTPGDNYYISVYNVDVNNGNFLTNDELLFKLGKTNEIDLNKAIHKVVDEKIQSEGEYSEYYGISININSYDNMPLFINGNGKLSTVVEYVVPAGSGGPWGIITEVE